MEGTSSTPHLLTDVRFSVSRKGYDPDEVDNFLERVSAAVAQLQDKLRQAAAQAESAEVRATEASRSQAALQQRVQELETELAAARREGPVEATSPVRSPEEEADQVSKVLVLAQRTADAAIDEANATARSTVADARSEATALVNDAQEEAGRLLGQARTEAEAIVARRREALAEEVRALESVRNDVTADLSALESHAAEQRTALQSAVSRLQAVLDDPKAFRLAAGPDLSGASADDVVLSEPEPEPEIQTSSAWGSQPATDSGDDDRSDVEESGEDPPDVPDFVATADPDGADGADGAGSGPADAASDEGPGPSTDQSPRVNVVFEDDRPTAAVPSAGNLFGPDAEEESPLGPPDDEADAAMRAFFEAEFDDDPGRGAR